MRFKKPCCFPSSRAALALGLLAAALAAQAPAPLLAPPLANAIRAQVIRNFESDQAALLRTSHLEHVVVEKDGTREGRSLRVWYVNGHEISETFALDARTLSPAELAAEHQRALERARQADTRPAPPPGLQFEGRAYPYDRLADDYVYGPAQVRQWQGRTVWVYTATPNPHASARSRAETLLSHSQAEIWVDAEDLHVVRIAAQTTAPVRYGLGVLATIHGATLDLQLERHAPGLWLPASADFSLRATVLMVKSLTRGKQQRFYDYGAN